MQICQTRPPDTAGTIVDAAFMPLSVGMACNELMTTGGNNLLKLKCAITIPFHQVINLISVS